MNYFKNRIDKVVMILDRQLQNRQLVTFAEKFKEIQKKFIQIIEVLHHTILKYLNSIKNKIKKEVLLLKV